MVGRSARVGQRGQVQRVGGPKLQYQGSFRADSSVRPRVVWSCGGRKGSKDRCLPWWFPNDRCEDARSDNSRIGQGQLESWNQEVV